MTISYITLLPTDNAQADAVDFGITIEPKHVNDSLIKVDVVAIISNVSNELSIVVNVLYFLFFFFDVVFILRVKNHFFIIVN